jgi:hypothetical protein
MDNIEITESLGSVSELTGKRLKIRLIEGDKLGSSAYYPADVVRRDGPKVFTKGTPMFLDHQTPEEKTLRPFGSVGSFVGELAEDAYYENDGLYGEVEVFEDMAPLIKSRMNRIGISVRANVVAEEGVINGKRVPIAQQFTSARSVDFVMRPGAGGKIVSILESAVEDEETRIEESGDTMELKDIVDGVSAAIKSEFETRFTAIEEALKPVEEKPVEESADDTYAKALEIAEAFVNSTLDADGRARVLDLHKANSKPIAELIAAEEAYVKAHGGEAEVEGVEEGAGKEVEESAKGKITVPTIGAWNKKDK